MISQSCDLNISHEMTHLEIVLFLLLLIGEVIMVFLLAFTRKVSENNADILQNQKKYYESEKGKNLATKEDIEEITRKVEEVKTEVSLSKQKTYEIQQEQERVLIGILADATKVSQSQNKLLLYLYDTSSRGRFDNLVEDVNDTLAHFYQLCNLATVSVQIEGVNEAIKQLSIAVTYLGSQVNVMSANAANLVEQFNELKDFTLNKATSDQVKTYGAASSINTKQQLDQMRGKSVPGKEELQKAIESYCLWLKSIYGKDLFVFKS